MARGPHRVVTDAEGYAVRPGETGIAFEVIFIREDGWSLAAPKELEEVARKQWPDQWIGVMRYGKGGWQTEEIK
jgi:hypothetical protein